MAEIKWIKIATDVFDNRKMRQIEIMPDGDSVLVIWFKLLCLAGNVNDKGLIYFTNEIPYTDQMLAAQFSRPLTTVQMALTLFQKFGMIDIIDDIIHVSSWEKYQNVEGMEKVREQNRIRKAKQRENQKLLQENVTGHVTVTQCHATDIDIDKELDIEEDKEIKEKNNKKKKSTSVDFQNIFSSYTSNQNLLEALNDYLDMRVSVKSVPTEKAINMMLKKLDTLAENDNEKIEVLNNSTMNNYKGIFALKDKPKGDNNAGNGFTIDADGIKRDQYGFELL